MAVVVRSKARSAALNSLARQQASRGRPSHHLGGHRPSHSVKCGQDVTEALRPHGVGPGWRSCAPEAEIKATKHTALGASQPRSLRTTIKESDKGLVPVRFRTNTMLKRLRAGT